MRWVTFFSQTGTEIYNLSKELNKQPDVIITNNNDINAINLKLINELTSRFIFLDKKPKVEDYRKYLLKDDLVTLHGWLRIVPEEICKDYNIYNLHPAPLTTYPFLKGKDPQNRTIEMNLEYGGSTIHICSPELDSGEIITENKVYIANSSEDEKREKIYKSSFELWKTFLTERLT